MVFDSKTGTTYAITMKQYVELKNFEPYTGD